MEFDGTHVHSLHRFVKHPEYLKEGQRLVFREGRTKAVGNVNKIIPYVPAVQGKDKTKQAAKQLQQVRGEGKRRTQGSGERASSQQDSTVTNAASIQGLPAPTNGSLLPGDAGADSSLLQTAPKLEQSLQAVAAMET
jgi:hypothetical protein